MSNTIINVRKLDIKGRGISMEFKCIPFFNLIITTRKKLKNMTLNIKELHISTKRKDHAKLKEE